MSNEKALSITEAYAAMYAFLENEYSLTESDDIGGLLGGMSLLDDGATADPSAWENWLQALQKVTDGSVSLSLEIKSE